MVGGILSTSLDSVQHVSHAKKFFAIRIWLCLTTIKSGLATVCPDRKKAMSTYLDANGYPAILLAFGYSRETDKTTKVITVRAGRVVILQLTAAQFDTEYEASEVPFLVAIRSLERIARTVGCDVEAHRTILHFLNKSSWRLKLVDCRLRIRSLLTGRQQAGW